MANQKQATPPAASGMLPEAPASVTIKFTFNGYDTMLTLRGHTGGEVLTKLNDATQWLDDHGAEPTFSRAPAGGQVAAGQNGSGGQPWESAEKICPIHGAKMTRREKQGDVWWSHKAWNPDTGEEYWCRGGEE